MEEQEVKNVETENKEEKKVSSIEEAKEVLQELTKQNEIMAQNLEKAEEINAHNLLSGKAEAGIPPPKKVDEATEIAKKVMLEAGYDPSVLD